MDKRIQVAGLRAKVGRIVRSAPVATKTTSEDSALICNGLPRACIHEIEGAGWDVETGVAPCGFVAAMLAHISEGAILWAVRDDGPFPPSLASFGIDLNRVIFCQCRKDAEVLAVLEDGLRTPGIAAVVGEVQHVTLTQSRRLHLICERAGNTGLLLRRRFRAASHAERKAEGSAAATRWRVQFAPTQSDEPGLGPLRWSAELLYRRGGMPTFYLVEWDDEAGHLRVVAELADYETVPQQFRLRGAG